MQRSDADILTDRLKLSLMSVAALKATQDWDLECVATEIGLSVPAEWLDLSWLAEMRLRQIDDDPHFAGWSIRAISLREERAMVGFINCHAAPCDGRVEVGYEIFPQYRRRGFAFEAAAAFLEWAKTQKVAEAVFSIAPENQPSLALKNKLGAQRIGSHVDEKDGFEDIYLLRL